MIAQVASLVVISCFGTSRSCIWIPYGSFWVYTKWRSRSR